MNDNNVANELKISPTGFIKKFQGTYNAGNSCYFQTSIRLFACHPVWMHYLELLYKSKLAQQPSNKNGEIDGESAQTKQCFLRKLYELVKITHNIHNGVNDQGSCNETIGAITEIMVKLISEVM